MNQEDIAGKVKWVQENREKWRSTLKEVLYLYHDMARYKCILGESFEEPDFPYWKYINLGYWDLGTQYELIREGCLVMMAAWVQDFFDEGDGTMPKILRGERIGMNERYFEFLNELECFEPKNTRERELHSAVMTVLTHLMYPAESHRVIQEKMEWIYTEYIEHYFRQMAKTYEETRKERLQSESTRQK